MKTVLLIDDDPDFQRLVAHQLEGIVRILSTEDAFQGLRMAAEDKPDVILLDLSLPQVDGLGILKRLQERPDTRSIPVVFVTANDQSETIVKALGAGAIDYLTKPIVQLTIQSRVRSALRTSLGPSQTLNEKTILLIDDDPNMHNLMDLYLKGKTKRVLHAVKATMGQRIAADDKPDLIILDLNMPQIDGFEAYRAMRSDPATSAIPVVFLTVDDKPFRSAKALDLGAADYIIKPVDEDVLLARIKAAFRRETP